MAQVWDWLLSDAAGQVIFSVIIVTAIVLARIGLIRQIRGRSEFLSERQRRAISFTRNAAFLFIVVGLAWLWAEEIRQFALSVAAVTVALVLATKELFLCMSGYLLKTSAGAFAVGDWVEVNGVRGEVIHQSLLSTTIQEIEGGNRYTYSGKTTTLPNSVFLTNAVQNLNFMRRYVFHRFTITLPETCDVYGAADLVCQRAEEYSEPFIEVARRYNRLIEARAGLDIPSPEPQVEVGTNNEARYLVTVTLFCPTVDAVELEQQLSRDVIAFVRKAHGRPLPV